MSPLKMKEPEPSGLISEDKIPIRITTKSEEWVAFLTKIPKGQAFKTNREELGVTASSLKSTVARLIERGQLPPYFYVRQHKKQGEEIIYIVHSARKVVRRRKSKSKEINMDR